MMVLHEAEFDRNEMSCSDECCMRLENYWDWSQSACRLGGADYGGLDMLNAKMIHTGSRDMCRWRLREFERGRPRET